MRNKKPKSKPAAKAMETHDRHLDRAALKKALKPIFEEKEGCGFLHKDRAFTVTATDLQQNFEKNRPVFDSILGSFQFDD